MTRLVIGVINKYAFEEMHVKRVAFSVDPTNENSNKAMKRLGAKYEGTLRKWRPLDESDTGDRNIYSIVAVKRLISRQKLYKLKKPRCRPSKCLAAS